MATAQVQQVVAAPVHDNDRVKEDEMNNEIIQDPPCGKVEEQESDANVPNNGDTKDEEVPADDTDESQRIAQEVEAKLAVQPVEAEAKDAKGGRPRDVKKAEKASAKGVVVPVGNDTDNEVVAPEGVKKPEKAADKWTVVPADDEKDDEVVAPAGYQALAAVHVAFASEEVVEAGGEEATKGGEKDACEEKDHEE